MRFSCDRTGFPLIESDGPGPALSVLPVTKVQFEQFLVDTGAFDEDWYRTLLAVNPRTSWRAPVADHRGLFLSGIEPAEALRYIQWLGPDFDLPTVAEWRAWRAWAMRPVGTEGHNVDELDLSDAARAILTHVFMLSGPTDWARGMLMEGGSYDWVRNGSEFGGLGRPVGHTIDPSHEPPMNYTRPGIRLPVFGFRVIRRTSSSPGRKETLWNRSKPTS